jgi:predicted enzyme related to lactoylglutathione lyase
MRHVWLFILASAASLTVRAGELPAINSPATTDCYPGKFVWADLLTSDQASAATFYTQLFGWTAATIDRSTPERGPLSFIVLSNAGRPVAGLALGPKRLRSETRGHWLGFVSVRNVTQSLALAVAGGGHVLSPEKVVPQRGTQAIFTDPEGAMLGIVHSSSGDPGEYRPEVGDFTWAEAFARDTGQAAMYYRSVLGYSISLDPRSDRVGSYLFASGGFARASIAPLPRDRPTAHPAWLLFVRVSNLDSAVASTKALGGRVLVEPKALSGNSRIAVIADPVGAAIGLVEREEATPDAAQK